MVSSVHMRCGAPLFLFAARACATRATCRMHGWNQQARQVDSWWLVVGWCMFVLGRGSTPSKRALSASGNARTDPTPCARRTKATKWTAWAVLGCRRARGARPAHSVVADQSRRSGSSCWCGAQHRQSASQTVRECSAATHPGSVPARVEGEFGGQKSRYFHGCSQTPIDSGLIPRGVRCGACRNGGLSAAQH